MRAPAAPNTEYSRQIMSQNHGRGRTGDEFDEKIVIVRGAHTPNAEIIGPLISRAPCRFGRRLTIPLPHSQPIIVAVFKKVRFELRGQFVESRRAAMGQFHVTVYVNNRRSAQLATAAMLHRTLVAMGSDIDEDVESHRVRSIDRGRR